MNKNKFITFILLMLCISLIVLGIVKLVKKGGNSELTQMVNRYREIQDEYAYHEGILNDLHNEAENIREEALDKYGIVFTEAGLEVVR